MQKDRSFWGDWAHFLRQSGLAEMAAAFLEAGGPLHVFFAQALYLGRPFLEGVIREDRMQALADLFETPDESRLFAAYLREESSG